MNVFWYQQDAQLIAVEKDKIYKNLMNNIIDLKNEIVEDCNNRGCRAPDLVIRKLIIFCLKETMKVSWKNKFFIYL